MSEFKSNEVKKVGKVLISAKRLKELAEKLEKTRETDGNVEVDLYLVPNEDKKTSQIAFDFSVEEVKKEEEKVVEEEPKKEDEVVEEKPKEEVKVVEEPVVEKEVPRTEPVGEGIIKQADLLKKVTETPAEPVKTEEKVVEEVKVEEKPVVPTEEEVKKEEELAEKAKEITAKAEGK